MAQLVTTTPKRIQARAEIQVFFDAFARALVAGDGPGIAGLWETPAFVLGDEAIPVTGRQELESFFGNAKARYEARGITGTRAEIMDLRRHNDRIAMVEVRWPYLDADGNERGEERSTYTLRRGGKGLWKLRIAVMHGATES